MQTLDSAPEIAPGIDSPISDRRLESVPSAFTSAWPKVHAGDLHFSPGQIAEPFSQNVVQTRRQSRPVRVDWYQVAVILLGVSCAVVATARLVWAMQP